MLIFVVYLNCGHVLAKEDMKQDNTVTEVTCCNVSVEGRAGRVPLTKVDNYRMYYTVNLCLSRVADICLWLFSDE